MNTGKTREAAILGFFIFAGLALLGYFVATTALQVKAMDRIVTVKGLAEREVNATVAIWPVSFNEAGNDLEELYAQIEHKSGLIIAFLKARGFNDTEISTSQPNITDRLAQNYGDTSRIKFRFTANATVTVYSRNIAQVRTAMKQVVELGKAGIALSGQNYQTPTEFLFTELNALKPAMIEEATNNAREVAEKFARDSHSSLGKIKRASQGQFSISDRDRSTPYIKKVRVVSTVTYYLSD